jgi:fused signal recognition particle receptor
MVALWIVLSVVVVAALVGGVTLLTGRRRRGTVREPDAPTTPAPSRPQAAPPPRPQVAPEAPPAPDEVGTVPTGAPLPLEVEQAPAVPEAGVPAPPSFKERLGRARGVFGSLRSLRSRTSVDPSTWDELEETLLRADVGVAATGALLADLQRRMQAGDLAGGSQLLDALHADLVDLLAGVDRWEAATNAGSATGSGPSPKPDCETVEPAGRELRFDGEDGTVDVWLFVGVNGVGKTTTVGKVARRQAAAGRSVLLAAGDTFRAAAAEQLAMWAERVGTEVVRGAEGGDPSAVVFDAVQRAASRGKDLVLADTAGRLHTKVNLVEELKKIRRVADRAPGRVTEVLLVLDATTGQNGLVQARQFTDAVAVTGVVLTKLDGTAKGGVVVAVQRELGLPVKLVGLGEGPDDLVPFEPEQFVDALLG